MNLRRLPFLAAVLAALAGSSGDAAAQGFFERLFGLRPAQPSFPPQPVPQRGPFGAPPGPMQGVPGVEGEPGAPVGPIAPMPPAPPKPIVLKPPSEDSILGRELKLPRLTLCLCCVYALLVPTHRERTAELTADLRRLGDVATRQPD